MKYIILFLFVASSQNSFAQNGKDSGKYVLPDSTIKLDFAKRRLDAMAKYVESINNYTSGALPGFLFEQCFDQRVTLWETLHSPASLRWEVLKKVTNKHALKQILDTQCKALKIVCDYKPTSYPHLVIPMIEKSFYELIEERYKQL
jgi:hypothetical protein